jgi:enoyl-CoA hydratase/carnithine racemase
MAYDTILYEVTDRVALVTLDRPEVMNAWNPRVADEVSRALAAADENDEVRAVVVTGRGRAFCAGADLTAGSGTFADGAAAGKKSDPERALSFLGVWPFQIRKPVLAAINGHAIGVGITFAMTCDIRIVAEKAKLQFAFVRRGVIPELCSHLTVARVAGLSNAADLLLTGRFFNGREMAEMGLASRALPAEEVLPAALELAREFGNASPVAVAISKKLLWEGLTLTPEQMHRREFPLFRWIATQPDAVEGVQSFLEKRDPEWKLSVNRDLPDLLKRDG